MEIMNSILTQNPCYQAGKKITVKGLMLHSVGCPQPSAEVFVRKWNSPEAASACVHAFIDGNTGKVYQTLPWDHRAWHCGGGGNNSHIGVEMCEPSCIRYTGGASFTCSDREKAMEVVERTYRVAVELFAALCKQFGLNPLADGVILSHKEGHDRGIASGHGDPDHLWKGMDCAYSMDTFRRDVNAALGGAAAPDPVVQIREEKAAAAETAATGAIHPGAAVRLAMDAAYYEGNAIPDWVKRDTWIVKSVSGDRVVISQNISGSNAINSPIHIKYLTVAPPPMPSVTPPPMPSVAPPPMPSVTPPPMPSVAPPPMPSVTPPPMPSVTPPPMPSVAPPPMPSVAPPPMPSVTPPLAKTAAAGAAGEMAISDRGMELIAKYEGCRLEAYQCSAGVWTIGYGHTAGVKPGDKLPSEAAAKSLLREDLEKYGAAVNNCVKRGLITFPLKQCQFDALTSFCYNCGAGSLQSLVTGRDAATVADKLLAYNKGGGKVLAGLTRRREEERALFLS